MVEHCNYGNRNQRWNRQHSGISNPSSSNANNINAIHSAAQNRQHGRVGVITRADIITRAEQAATDVYRGLLSAGESVTVWKLTQSVFSTLKIDSLESPCLRVQDIPCLYKIILLEGRVLSVVGLLQDEVDPMVSVMKVEKAPLESYADIGGLDAQIQEIKEAVELPLTHPELYEDIGIKPPKGVILYGEPGTGKTLLAKAVANSTAATFLRVVGSELIQKYLGDGPKLVRELFRVADDLSPSIVFIDEIDAVGTKRYDAHSGGEREIQRTMLELLNQLDGFDARGDVKVILATNRIESLDPALLRPGRIDRKIEFPLPDIKTRRRIFQIHTARMTLADDVNLEEFVMTKDEFSGADIKAICTEAGLLALRERRMKVTQVDFKKAKEKVMFKKKEGVPEGLYM